MCGIKRKDKKKLYFILLIKKQHIKKEKIKKTFYDIHKRICIRCQYTNNPYKYVHIITVSYEYEYKKINNRFIRLFYYMDYLK